MAKRESDGGFPFPLQVGLAMSLLGGLLTGASMVVIEYWPQPASVAPYFGFNVGFCWGAVVGLAFGVILGFLCDDTHFPHVDV